jgi:hypothetical protein
MRNGRRISRPALVGVPFTGVVSVLVLLLAKPQLGRAEGNPPSTPESSPVHTSVQVFDASHPSYHGSDNNGTLDAQVTVSRSPYKDNPMAWSFRLSSRLKSIATGPMDCTARQSRQGIHTSYYEQHPAVSSLWHSTVLRNPRSEPHRLSGSCAFPVNVDGRPQRARVNWTLDYALDRPTTNVNSPHHQGAYHSEFTVSSSGPRESQMPAPLTRSWPLDASPAAGLPQSVRTALTRVGHDLVTSPVTQQRFRASKWTVEPASDGPSGALIVGVSAPRLLFRFGLDPRLSPAEQTTVVAGAVQDHLTGYEFLPWPTCLVRGRDYPMDPTVTRRQALWSCLGDPAQSVPIGGEKLL